MKIDNRNPSVNQQDHPHVEGAQNNTPSNKDNNGQRPAHNNNQQMSNMREESEEQNAGRDKGRNNDQK